jgi:integration host factor subunit beta
VCVLTTPAQESQLKTVTKKELVHRIAEQMHDAAVKAIKKANPSMSPADQAKLSGRFSPTKVMVKDIVQAFLNSIIEELADGNRLEFREFGVFESRERAARLAQNPRTLEKVPVPAKRIVKFKVGRLMRKKVSGEDVGDLSLDDDESTKKAPVIQPVATGNDGESTEMS